MPQGPTKKQVHFNLTEDLGNTPPLSPDLAHFLGHITDKQIDAAHPPVPSSMSFPRPPSDGKNQHHDTSWEDPSQRPIPPCQTSLGLPVKPGPDEVVLQPCRTPWGVDLDAHEQEQVASQLVAGIHVTLQRVH